MIRFFRQSPLKQRRTKPKPLFRDSPRERGYNAGWDRFSIRYRARNPFCAVCMEKGRLTFCDVVDHKLPLKQGGGLLDPDNVWGLCSVHHSWKGRLEAYAEATGQVDKLVEWCDTPDRRPARM